MPTQSNWIIFEGYNATRRGAEMVTEARRLWHASKRSNGKRHPRIVQGGKSFSSKSGNTHAREAFDFDTGYLTDAENQFWEECLWRVGFAAWWRHAIAGLWKEHCHALPKGGDLSTAAIYQVWAFNNRRNGLKSDLKYPRIGKYAYQTWAKYLASRPKPAPVKPKPIRKFRLSDFKGSVKVAAYNRGYPSHVAVCQTALQALGYEPGPVDGIKGKQTISAMNRFLAKWGWESASGRILTLRQLDRLIWEAEKLHPGTGYPPRAEK